jgi:hypothetical protein
VTIETALVLLEELPPFTALSAVLDPAGAIVTPEMVSAWALDPKSRPKAKNKNPNRCVDLNTRSMESPSQEISNYC